MSAPTLWWLAAGFLVLAVGAQRAIQSGPVWPSWLIVTYLLHTWGELLLSPVGLSSVTQLAPRRLMGQMMGIWFVGASLGNLIAGLFAGGVNTENASQMPALFLSVVTFAVISGALFIIFNPILKKWMGNVK